MQLKEQSCSSTGLERLFGRLPHHREARSRRRSKAFGPSRRFSAWLARTSWCANLQQNHRHHPTYLLGSHRTIRRLPRSMQGLPQLTCQIELVKDQDHQPTPALKLSRRADMDTGPEQLLLEKAVVVLLREAATILRRHLRQGDDRIEHHKPTHARIPLGALGGFPLDADHREVERTILLEVQVVPAADLHPPTLRRLFTPHLISSSMRLGTFALKERTIFGRSASRVPAYGHTVELAIAFEPDQHAVAQLLAGPQELRRRVPAIRQDDHPPVPKERTQGLQLRNGDFDGGLLTADALLLQNGGPTAGLLRHQHHRRKRPADADGLVDQGQIRQMDDGAIRAGWGSQSGQVAAIHANPNGFGFWFLSQQHLHPEGSHLLDIDAPIFQGFVDTGPLPLKERRQRQFGQRLRLTFTQQGIAQVAQRIGPSFQALIDLLTDLLQSANIHNVNVLCFCVLDYKELYAIGQSLASQDCLLGPFSLNFKFNTFTLYFF